MGRSRVLIVEDDPDLRGALTSILARYGFDTVGAADGRDALDAIGRSSFDAIICDVRLPGMNGIHVLREIRKRLPRVRGIIITGYASETAPVEAIQAGVDGYFRKPFDLEEIVRLLREKLEESSALREEEERMAKREARYPQIIKTLINAIGQEKAGELLRPTLGRDPEGKRLLAALLRRNSLPLLQANSSPYEAEWECQAYLVVSLMYADAGEDEFALEALERAFPLLDRLVDPELESEIVYLLGRLKLRDGREEGVKECLGRLEVAAADAGGTSILRLKLLQLHMTLEATPFEKALQEIHALLPQLREAALAADEAELLLAAAALAERHHERSEALKLLVQGGEVLLQYEFWPLFFRLLPMLFPIFMGIPRGEELSPVLQALLGKLAECGPSEKALLLDLQGDAVRTSAGRLLSMVSEASHGTLQIFAFGGLRLFRNGSWVGQGDFTRRKVKYLLAYLLWKSPNSVSEELLLDALWSDVPPERSRQALYSHVSILRYLLEPGLSDGRKSRFIVVRQGHYQFVADAPVWCDLFNFRRKFQRGRAMVNAGNRREAVLPYTEAIRLYLGPFVSDCLEEWCLPIRASLESEYLGAARFLAGYWEKEAVWERAAEFAHKILLVDHLDEEEHRRLMRCSIKLSRPHQALRQFAVCQELLKRDLDAQPALETIALYLEAGGQ